MANKSDDMFNDLICLLTGETDKLKGEYDEALIEEFDELVNTDPKELQKKYQDEAYEKYLEKFSSTVHLWKLDDKQWVNDRKSIWERMVEREKKEASKFVKSYWDEAGRFFLRAKPRKNDDEIYVYRRMTYTPFSSVEEIRELYMREHVSLRQDLHNQLLTYASRSYRAVPEEFHRVELIAKALYCDEYVAKKEIMGHEQKPKFTVYYPRDFIISYTREVRNYLKRSKSDYLEKLRRTHNQHWTGHERSFAEVTTDYFLGTLEYAVNNDSDEYGGVICDSGIDGVKEICSLIESYKPDIFDENRDRFVESAHEKIINNDVVKKVRKMQA